MTSTPPSVQWRTFGHWLISQSFAKVPIRRWVCQLPANPAPPPPTVTLAAPLTVASWECVQEHFVCTAHPAPSCISWALLWTLKYSWSVFFFYVAIDSVSAAVLLLVQVRAGRLHQFGIIFSPLTKFLRYRSHSLDCRVMPKQKQTQNGLIYASESLVRFYFCVSRTSLAGWERVEINSHKVRNLSKFCKTFAAEAVKLCIIKLLRKLLQGEGPID